MRTLEIKKYDYIDALRGFAILGVVLVHSSQWVNPTSSILLTFATEGAMGVQLFYVASALTLFLSMSQRRQQEDKPLLGFFIRRFFRIAPAFYGAIIVYTFYRGMGPSYWAPNGLEWWHVSLTALFMHGWHPETINSVVPGGWSIAVEMTFYLFVPFLFSKLTSIRITLIALLASLLFSRSISFGIIKYLEPLYSENLHHLVYSFENLWFFSQLPVFISGILLYHLILKFPTVEKNTAILIQITSFYLIVAFASAQTWNNLLPKHVLYGFAFVLFSLSLYYSPSKIFVNKIMVVLGRLSFSIYLVHFMVLSILKNIFLDGFVLDGNIGFLSLSLLVLAVSTMISYVTNRLVELPGIKMGKALVKRIQKTPAFG